MARVYFGQFAQVPAHRTSPRADRCKMKKSVKTGPTTVVISREDADLVDDYCRAHPLKPRRKHVIALAIQEYIQNEIGSSNPHGDE